MARKALNFAAFYAGYLACVFGAGRGQAQAATATAFVLLGMHLWQAPERWREARLLGAAGILGLAAESAHTLLGFVEFSGRELSVGSVPVWMIALWMLFASTLRFSLSWLAGRYALGAALGSVAGPFSYYAAVPIGAVRLHPDVSYSLLGLAVVWAMATPLLLRLAALSQPPQPRMAARARDVSEKSSSST